VSGHGFGAFEKIKISFIDSVQGTIGLGKTSTDASGAFSKRVTIPSAATAAAQKIKVKGLVSHVAATKTFTVK